MKTIHEQIYEYLLNQGKPLTSVQVGSAEAFKGVPDMVVGKALLALCGEGLVKYYMKDGKMCFTTDLSVGRGPIGSKANIDFFNNALAALFGGGGGNPLAGMNNAFPETGDDKIDKKLDKVTFSAVYRHDTFEIAFPESKSKKDEPDDEHEFVVKYSARSGIPVELMTTNLNEIDGDNTLTSVKTTIKSICSRQIKQVYKCLDAPEEYQNNGVVAYYLPVAPYTIAFIARPDGIHFLRIDWKFGDDLPSKKAVCCFIERWLETYKYVGEKQYRSPIVVDNPEMLKIELTDEAESEISEAYYNCANETARQISMITTCATVEEATDKPTKVLLNVRKSLEEAAQLADDFVVQTINLINHYKNVNGSRALLKNLYNLAGSILNVSANIKATVAINVNNIPYYAKADIVAGANSTEEEVVQIFPAHFLDFLDLLTTQRCKDSTLDEGDQQQLTSYRDSLIKTYEEANTQPTYYTDFIIENGLLAAYLGNAEDVVVPETVSSIGDFAFKNAKALKKIILGEKVKVIGFNSFEGCDNLETIIMKGDVEAINGLLLGFGHFSQKSVLTVEGYADSYVEEYCKENNIIFKAIKEDNLDCIVKIADGEYDTFAGFALPKFVGFKTTEELSDDEAEKLGEDDATAHILYGAVPADQELANYKDVSFSLTVVHNPIELPQGGLDIAWDIENRLNQRTLYDRYKTAKNPNDKLVIRYNITNEGEDNGVKWTIYVIVIAKDDMIITPQVFFNGNYTHRQQQYAIEKWARLILTDEA